LFDPQVLDEKASAAIKKWRFQPALKDGKPVAVYVAVEVKFVLDGQWALVFLAVVNIAIELTCGLHL